MSYKNQLAPGMIALITCWLLRYVTQCLWIMCRCIPNTNFSEERWIYCEMLTYGRWLVHRTSFRVMTTVGLGLQHRYRVNHQSLNY